MRVRPGLTASLGAFSRGRLTAVGLMAAALVLGGCSTESNTSADGDKDNRSSGDGTTKIACLMIDLSLEAFKDICEGVKIAGEANGAEVVFADGKSDPSTQSQLMDSFPAQGVDAVVVIAQDPNLLQASIERAQEAGIVVIGLGSDLKTAEITVVSDFYAEGQRSGEAVNDYVRDHLEPGTEVLVTNYPQTPVLQERAQGTIDAIKAGGVANVVEVLPANSRDEGIKAAQSALSKHPDIRVMTCISDDACLGGAQAFREAGIPASESFLIGTDATSSAYAALEDDDTGFKATAGYGLRVFGAAGTLRGLACMAGEDLERSVTMQNQIVTKENLDEFKALDQDPIRAYNDYFDRYLAPRSDTPADCS
jgi:ribose transport system substrate-binding protein